MKQMNKQEGRQHKVNRFNYNNTAGFQKILKNTLNYQDVLSMVRQEDVFSVFLNDHVSLNNRYYSPFPDRVKPDSSPGCRFKWYKNWLYFIENASYKGKVAFNCFQLVQYMHDINFGQAVALIVDRMGLKSTSEVIFKSIDKPKIIDKPRNIIKFTYNSWSEPNYYTSNFDISTDYLNKQPYYNVKSYWINTAEDRTVIKNRFGNNFDCIAYHFKDTNQTKLYWPEKERPRFWSNADNTNIFGWHRMGDYLFGDSETLLITKSAKDEMILNFHFNLNTIGFQGESIKEIPDKLIRILKLGKFKEIIILWDSDEAGYSNGFRLNSLLKSHFPCINIRNSWYHAYNDTADAYTNIKKELINFI